uniref:Uncharacterized protein n=1 Tax=Oryza glumipatula TaxID=40148 RepID=A0A0D9YC43_9ORYZ
MLHDSQPLSLDTTPTSADPIRVCIIGPQSGQRRWTNRLSQLHIRVAAAVAPPLAHHDTSPTPVASSPLRDMEQQTTSYEELDGGFCAYYCGTASLVPLLAVASISLVNNRGPFPDLPLAICFSEGQPDSIVQDIENMVRSFIEKALINREWREYNLIMSKLWSAQPGGFARFAGSSQMVPPMRTEDGSSQFLPGHAAFSGVPQVNMPMFPTGMYTADQMMGYAGSTQSYREPCVATVGGRQRHNMR